MIIRVVVPLCMIFSLLVSCGGSLQTIEKVPQREDAQISKSVAARGDRVLKRKVAIARFSNETKAGKSSFFDDRSDRTSTVDPVEKQAMDILSTRLASTEKFILLERADLDLLNKELGMANLEQLNIAADYLIVGSVSEFGRNTTGQTGVFSRSKKQTAYARVNIRLIDVHTGHIIFSQEGEGEAYSEAGTVLGFGGSAGYDGTLNDKAISAAISKVVGNVVENLLEKPWRSFILDYAQGSYIISGGVSQGLKVGDTFAVIKKGSMVKNPQTGMMIELPGEEAGTLKVTALLGDTQANEVAMCIKDSGDLPLDQFADYYVQELR